MLSKRKQVNASVVAKGFVLLLDVLVEPDIGTPVRSCIFTAIRGVGTAFTFTNVIGVIMIA